MDKIIILDVSGFNKDVAQCYQPISTRPLKNVLKPNLQWEARLALPSSITLECGIHAYRRHCWSILVLVCQIVNETKRSSNYFLAANLSLFPFTTHIFLQFATHFFQKCITMIFFLSGKKPPPICRSCFFGMACQKMSVTHNSIGIKL